MGLEQHQESRDEFRAEKPRLELWCRICGYGIVIPGPPPACPMCRSEDWVPRVIRRRLEI